MTTGTAVQTIDWAAWRKRWDRQQSAYLPGREERFSLMLDYVARMRGDGELAVLDLCCGCGSISERVRARFPESRVVAIDVDTALLELGKRSLMDPAVTWIQADLRGEGALQPALDAAGRPFDVALSATALHWFWPEELVSLYRGLAGVMAPGGVFLNADHYPLGIPSIDDASVGLLQELIAVQQEHGAESYVEWWDALRADSALDDGLADAFVGHDTFINARTRPEYTRVGFQVEALRLAGFSDVGEVWRHLRDAIMLAVR